MWVSLENELDKAEVNLSVKSLFSSILTGSIGVGNSSPWIFTAYLAMDQNKIWFTSQESTRHVSIIKEFGTVSVCIWSEPKMWGDPLNGIQLEGEAKEVLTVSGAKEGLAALHNKFTGIMSTLPNPSDVLGTNRKTTMFVIKCKQGSLRDQLRFGKGAHFIQWNK